jgi:hypothetical protein
LKEILSNDHPLVLMLNLVGEDRKDADQFISFLRDKYKIKKDELISILLQAIDYNSKIQYQDFINLARTKYEEKEGKKFGVFIPGSVESHLQALELKEINERILDNQIEKFMDRMREQEHKDAIEQSLNDLVDEELLLQKFESETKEREKLEQEFITSIKQSEREHERYLSFVHSLDPDSGELKPGKIVNLTLLTLLTADDLSSDDDGIKEKTIKGTIQFVAPDDVDKAAALGFHPGSIGVTLFRLPASLPFGAGKNIKSGKLIPDWVATNIVMEKLGENVWVFDETGLETGTFPYRIVLDRS